ncbi:hypothetical protein BB934_40815 (plasmid) [Microvirga ossetica]|uniref:Uncharacterized protein n=1 Tax=Microvirga ossetica TaxID=1882682 RepID=A0A1B2EX89_9HYPH|nr:hypothetical protein BB934_40815 [Microvirga ossetica]
MEPQQCGSLGSHLHETNFADAANGSRIVPAFDPHHRVDKGRRHPAGCGLLSDGRQMRGAIFQSTRRRSKVQNGGCCDRLKIRRQGERRKLPIHIDFEYIEVRLG